MRISSLPGSGRDADVHGGGRTSLMAGAACVSKERVPASLRIRPKSPRNHAHLIPSRFGARCGRAGRRRSHVSYDGRSVRFQRARARFPAHPLERSACKSGSDFSFFRKLPRSAPRSAGSHSGRLAKQLARGGARPPRSSGKTAARGACRNMALQILRAVVYLSLMTVCGTGLSPCRTNAKGTQNARENFLLHF